MTLIEMLIAVLLVSAGLFMLIGSARIVREDARRELARRVLAAIDQALAQYQRAEGRYPPGRDDDPDSILTALMRHGKTRRLADAIPEALWTVQRPRSLLDPWGTPLRCLVDPQTNECVRANQGRPVFVSAGPDGQFGDDDPAQIGDNLRSDDPDADGFRDSAPVDAGAHRSDDARTSTQPNNGARHAKTHHRTD